jgi:hypothetical protein
MAPLTLSADSQVADFPILVFMTTPCLNLPAIGPIPAALMLLNMPRDQARFQQLADIGNKMLCFCPFLWVISVTMES